MVTSATDADANANVNNKGTRPFSAPYYMPIELRWILKEAAGNSLAANQHADDAFVLVRH